jgi:3-hydroxy-9,10-secoandrosta-1,3,5(10)-triene-9,17-dione monooxygenase
MTQGDTMTVTNTLEAPLESQREIEARLVQSARDMRAELLEQAPAVEERTFYSEEIHRRFDELGFYRMLIPKAHGGLEVGLDTFYRVVIELARADMSTAWCFTLSANHALMFANWFPEAIHEEVYAGGDFRAASMYAPTVKATPVDGGWQLDGTVNYCSGIPYSTYFIGQCILPGKNDDGSPRFGLYIAPKRTYTRLDDWGNMLGLNGSGSHSIRFDGALLPERFMVEDANLIDYAFDGDSPGSAAYGNPMYSGRHMSSFAIGLAALVIGAGYNALDEYENLMRTRKTTIPPFVMRTEDPDFLRWYGSALVKLQAAEGALFSTLERWMDAARKNVAGTETFSAHTDNLLGGIGRELMLQVWESVDRDLYRTVGSAASKRGERFERVFRDLAQATGHRNPQLREPSYRLIAAGQLGLG